jgi:hypothetical protein
MFVITRNINLLDTIILSINLGVKYYLTKKEYLKPVNLSINYLYPNSYFFLFQEKKEKLGE